jgi:hypothetical protein
MEGGGTRDVNDAATSPELGRKDRNTACKTTGCRRGEQGGGYPKHNERRRRFNDLKKELCCDSRFSSLG